MTEEHKFKTVPTETWFKKKETYDKKCRPRCRPSIRRLDINDWLMISSILAIVLCSGILLYAGNTAFPDKVYITQTLIKEVYVPQAYTVVKEVPVEVQVPYEIIVEKVVEIKVPYEVIVEKVVEIEKKVILDLSKEKLADCIRISTDNGEILDCGVAGIYRWKI